MLTADEARVAAKRADTYPPGHGSCWCSVPNVLTDAGWRRYG